MPAVDVDEFGDPGLKCEVGERAADHSLYIGNVTYTDLDAVGVVVESTQPDQVLRVSKIEAFQ